MELSAYIAEAPKKMYVLEVICSSRVRIKA